MKGTVNKTPAELEEAIGLLGARISISSDLEALYVTGNTLSRNLEQTISLVTEMLTQPRWDSEAYDIVKNRRLTSIKQSKTRAQLVSINALRKQLYGKSHPRSFPVGGTIESVDQITMKDLKDHFYKYISPKAAHMHIVGDVNMEKTKKALKILEKNWSGDLVDIPKVSNVKIPSEPKLFFIDIPSAKQSAITIGKPIVKGSDLNHYKIQVVNNRLGAGSSARLFQTLRIEKGYTYGAYSNISENQFQSTFLAYGQVRTNVTLESLEIFRQLIRDYSKTFEESDLEKTKNLLIKQNTRRFETLSNLLNMLDSMSRFELKESYIEEQQEILVNMDLDEIRDLANRYLNENNMIYVIAGDAKTQLSEVKEFGYGDPIILDRDGNKVSNNE
ncbi:MAG: M16 family metallopeptidase [Candidatus Neomarinimicrobiota bacterium]